MPLPAIGTAVGSAAAEVAAAVGAVSVGAALDDVAFVGAAAVGAAAAVGRCRCASWRGDGQLSVRWFARRWAQSQCRLHTPTAAR